MKLCLIACFALIGAANATDQSSCLILKHATASEQFLVSGANWRFVAGDFPKGMKWKSNVRDRDVRKIKELGGKVAIVGPNYTPSDLEQAKQSCNTDIATKETK